MTTLDSTLAAAAGIAQQWLQSIDHDLFFDPAMPIPVFERLDWKGRPIDPGYRRVRVIARQCFVLCQAALCGNARAGELAEPIATALIRHGIDERGQFHCRLTAAGAVLDPTPDAYDIAFGLFALGWWYRLSGESSVLDLAETAIVRLRENLRSPSGYGYIYRANEPVDHAQNPQMHLFEAAIVLAEFSGRDIFMGLADEMFELARDKLYDPVSNTLPELFDDDWQPRNLAEAGGPVRVEPGHHYEWTWLLHRYGRLASCAAASQVADRLYEFALRHGHDTRSGLIYDAITAEGELIDPALRIWPNTEYLKAQVAMRESHGPGLGHRDSDVLENVDRIVRHYLTPAASGDAAAMRLGLWVDHLEADAISVRSDHVPASTLYHIVFAFSELLRHTLGRMALAPAHAAPSAVEAFTGNGWRS